MYKSANAGLAVMFNSRCQYKWLIGTIGIIEEREQFIAPANLTYLVVYRDPTIERITQMPFRNYEITFLRDNRKNRALE